MKKTLSNYKLIFTALVFSFFLFQDGGNVLAANTCSTAKPGFSCIDTVKNPNATGCVSNLCQDEPVQVKCCKAPAAANNPSATANPTNTNFGGGGTKFVNPLRFDNVDQFLSQIMGAIQKIIVTLSLLVIVYGAVLYVISAGSKMVDDAKKAITGALIGLALALAAPSFLKEIAYLLNWGTDDTRLAQALSLSEIAIKVLNFLLGSMGLLAIIMMVIGGVMYLTSAGDSGQVETGKKIFRYSLIGIFMALSSMVLVTQLAQLFVR